MNLIIFNYKALSNNTILFRETLPKIQKNLYCECFRNIIYEILNGKIIFPISGNTWLCPYLPMYSNICALEYPITHSRSFGFTEAQRHSLLSAVAFVQWILLRTPLMHTWQLFQIVLIASNFYVLLHRFCLLFFFFCIHCFFVVFLYCNIALNVFYSILFYSFQIKKTETRKKIFCLWFPWVLCRG